MLCYAVAPYVPSQSLPNSNVNFGKSSQARSTLTDPKTRLIMATTLIPPPAFATTFSTTFSTTTTTTTSTTTCITVESS
ncbi:cell wall integrity and stress response component 3-like [Polistes fuscatus]|uniref:cell wall integrity and stress response component 3-like n=1 Tax=Polistes fuscatus TaxID=30207 RepID=UPI001CA81E7F|nr:cell wall integrity and stress response component 3-like [Polistes fuscatus]